eukprot:474784-Pelagomonas_calceolata.AAC.2
MGRAPSTKREARQGQVGRSWPLIFQAVPKNVKLHDHAPMRTVKLRIYSQPAHSHRAGQNTYFLARRHTFSAKKQPMYGMHS